MRAMDMITAEIRRAYGTYTSQYADPNGWAMITAIAERVDLTKEELHAGLRHLMRNEGVVIVPTSNQKMLTETDWEWACWIGGQWKHAICFQ